MSVNGMVLVVNLETIIPLLSHTWIWTTIIWLAPYPRRLVGSLLWSRVSLETDRISLKRLQYSLIHSPSAVHLWGNKLFGSIPNTLSRLVNLHTIYLNNNYLAGEMGDTFDTLKNLKHLDLSSNRLRGHIPHGIGSLTNLRDLRLSNNLLTSTFPMSLISLSNLQTLLLDSNSISGSLPSLVGEMKSLVTIRYVNQRWRVLSRALSSVSSLQR